MAAYAVVDYVTDKQNTAAKVAALMETYLETKDSTTEAVIGMGIESVGGEFFGWIIHNGT
jgi:hypothetical protein